MGFNEDRVNGRNGSDYSNSPGAILGRQERAMQQTQAQPTYPSTQSPVRESPPATFRSTAEATAVFALIAFGLYGYFRNDQSWASAIGYGVIGAAVGAVAGVLLHAALKILAVVVKIAVALLGIALLIGALATVMR